MLDRAIALLGIAAVVIIGTATMPGSYKKWRPFGYAVGVALLFLAAVAWWWPDNSGSSSMSPTIKNSGNNNCNVAGSGNQVNCGSSSNLAHPLDEKLPGFASGLMVQTNDITEERKKYQFYFHTLQGSKAEFYLSASNRYAFSITDIHGSIYTLDIPLGSNGIPFEKFVYMFCEAGTASSYSYLRALVNGREVARHDFDFPLELGSRKWIPSFGADQNGKNGGAFMLMEMGAYSTTLSNAELMKLSDNALKAYGLK